MNLFKKVNVISLLVITLMSYSVVKQVQTAHVSIEVIEESDDPDSSLPKSESLTSSDNNSFNASHSAGNIAAVNKSITDDGTPHIIGATASTISPNDTMLADESNASPIAIAVSDINSSDTFRGEESKRPSDLLIDSAAKSAIAQLQYEASQGKASYSSFGFPLETSASEQPIHVLPNGDYVFDSPLTANIISSPAASQVTPVPALAPSSGGSNGFFSSLFAKSTPSSSSSSASVGGGVNSFITSGSSSVAGASDEESRLKSFLTSTATRFPFSGFLRGGKDIKQAQSNGNNGQLQGEHNVQQLHGHSLQETIVAEASNMSPSTSDNSGVVSIDSLNGAQEMTGAAEAAAAGAGSNIAVVDQTQFDPVQVELGLSAYPPGESVSPDLIKTIAPVNLPQGDSVSITSAGATLGQQSFTGQATSSSSQLNHHQFLHHNSQQVPAASYSGFFGKYRSRLPRIRINPFKSVWKGNEKNKQAAIPPIAPSNTGPVNIAQNGNNAPVAGVKGPLTYFKNTEPLVSPSKLTPKLPSIFLLPIKLFSSATKPFNMLIGRGKKGGKGKSLSLFSKRPIQSNTNPSNQHVLPLINTEQSQSPFVFVSDNSGSMKFVNEGRNHGDSVLMFVPKNQPLESAHHHHTSVTGGNSHLAASFVNSPHVALSSGFISNFHNDNNNSSAFVDASSVNGKDAIIIDENSAKNRIPFKSHLHFIEGQEQEEVNFPKDQETLIANEPEAQASDGSKVHHVPQSSETQQHVYIPSDLHEKIQQIQASLPQNVKEQLHAFAGKVISNPPSGDQSRTIPPALAAIAAQLSPEQIKSLAGVFLNVQQKQQQQQAPQVDSQPSLASFTLPETPFSIGNYKQQNGPSFIHSQQAQRQPQQQPQQQGQHQQANNQQASSASLRHRFHFRNPFKPAASNTAHQEESRNVPFLFFGDGGAGRGVSSFFRRPRLIPTNAHLHAESEIPVSHGESNAPEIQFIPLDGRPNGSPHMDQIEHMLSAALRPDAQAASEASEPNNNQAIMLNGQPDTRANGHYTVVPVGMSIASAHQLMPGVGEAAFLQGLPLKHNVHTAPMLFDDNGSRLVRRPHALEHKLLAHQNREQRRPGTGIGLPRVVTPPELGSAYSNGWIPKDLPQDWSPGPIRTPSPTASSEYDAFTKFTAADSITPRPPMASSSASRFTPPGQALRPISVTTSRPFVPSTEKVEVDDIHVEEARNEENRSKQLPKDKKKEFKKQETLRKKNATDSIKLTGKQQLIKLWLSQTQTPQDTVETTTSISTSTIATSSVSSVSSRQGKSLKESIKPSVTVSVSASLNSAAQDDQVHSHVSTVIKSTAAAATTTTTTVTPVTEAVTVVPTSTSADSAVASTSGAPVAASTTVTPVAVATVATSALPIAASEGATSRPSVARYVAERIVKSTTSSPVVSASAIEAVAKMEPITKVAKEGVIETIIAKDPKDIAKINEKDDLVKIWSPSAKVSMDDAGAPSSSTSPEPVYLSP